MSSRSKLIKNTIDKFKGILFYYKDPGDHMEKVCKWIRMHLEIETSVSFSKVGINIKPGLNLEGYSSGVTIIAIGDFHQYIKYSNFLELDYVVEANLGQFRDDYSVDGDVLKESNYDHVTYEKLNSVCEKFIGKYNQRIPPREKLWYRYNYDECDSQIIRRYYNPHPEKHERKCECKKISIIEFNPPKFKLYVNCMGNFFIRTLINDIGEQLNCGAYVTNHERIKYGPILKEHCLRKDDLYLKYIEKVIKQQAITFTSSVKPYIDLIPFYTERRI